VRHFSFSRQIQGAGEVIASLLDALLDAEHQDIWLRGVYLTSSLQRGRWTISSCSQPPGSMVFKVIR
jgi:type VI protein secretion system component VasK